MSVKAKTETTDFSVISVVLYSLPVRVYPQGDLNPCCRRERAASWASRRWGPRASLPSLTNPSVTNLPADCTAGLISSRQSGTSGGLLTCPILLRQLRLDVKRMRSQTGQRDHRLCLKGRTIRKVDRVAPNCASLGECRGGLAGPRSRVAGITCGALTLGQAVAKLADSLAVNVSLRALIYGDATDGIGRTDPRNSPAARTESEIVEVSKAVCQVHQ